ncbi:MAG: hypothetical protein AAFZ80_02875 [Cyanobacteria bacterium P01_A01_bin.105]
MSLPIVVNENQIKVFNFYQQGNIYQATFFRRRLHKLVRLFDLASRAAAYTLGYALAEKDDVVLVTVGLDGYKVWTDVRSEVAPQPICQLNRSPVDGIS